jgi:hypothetical protein
LRHGGDVAENGLESQGLPRAEQVQGTESRTSPNAASAAKIPSETEYELDSEPSDEDTEMPEGSLFDYNIPGVLEAEEVTKLDLDHWKLLVRNMLIDFEVRFIDLCPVRSKAN